MGTIPFVLGNALQPQKGVGRDVLKRTLEEGLGRGQRSVANFTGGFAAIFYVARAAAVPCHGGVGRGIVGRGIVGRGVVGRGVVGRGVAGRGGDGGGDATSQGNGSEE